MHKPPIILTTVKGLIPNHYRMLYQRKHCKRCGMMHSFDQVDAMIDIAGGLKAVPLHSTSDLEWNAPVKVMTLAPEDIPFCHMCYHPEILKGLPKLPPSQPKVAPSWAGTGLNPKGAPAKAAKAAKGPKVYTIDDLEI